MQNTILLISLSVVTVLAVGFFLRSQKSKNELKDRRPDGESGKGEMKTQEEASQI